MSARVLVLDDEAAIRALCRKLLLKAGLEPVEAASVAEARERIAGGGFALLIADLHLRDGRGWEAVAAFRERCPGASVLIITASPGEKDERRAAELGVQAWALKPFDIAELRGKVLRLVGRGP